MMFAKTVFRRRLAPVLLTFMLTAAAWPSNASGQVPRLISYQGTLTEDGRPASGTFEVTFSLYPAENGGGALWSATRQVTLREGRFSVLLGSTNNLPDDLFDGQGELYLQVQVGDGPPLPRLRVASTAYALRAAVAEVAEVAEDVADNAIGRSALGNGAVNTPQLADGAVTSDKLSDNAVQRDNIIESAVGSAQIADGAVTSDEILNNTIRTADLSDGAAVIGLNNLSGNISIVEGSNIEIETDSDGNTITISANFGPFDNDSARPGQPSARRWKTNVQPLEKALAKILRLRGVSFEWKESGRPDIGLIAEEVAQVVPELVTYENGRAQTLNYGHLTALLIEAVKAQQTQISRQRRAIARLKAQLAQLERKIKPAPAGR